VRKHGEHASLDRFFINVEVWKHGEQTRSDKSSRALNKRRSKVSLFHCEIKVCIQLFRGNFDANVPFNIRQPRGKVLWWYSIKSIS
jgi:hypothetical protein